MKKLGKNTILLYLLEVLFLVAAIALVIRWIPDLSKPSDSNAETTSEIETTIEGETEETEETTEETTAETSGEDIISEEGVQDKKAYLGGQAGKLEEGSEPETTEAPYMPPTLMVASDLHYMSPTMTDYGPAFERLTENDDGKILPYIDEITDAFLAEVTAQKPSALILSGDLSLNGEKVNHGELARKLRRVQAAGVPVLVIPGNHDINHPWAATYYGEDVVPSEGVDANGFYDIYHEFGYDGAYDRDVDSLSYLYKLDERYWLMMLDTCIYEPENEDGGRVRKETLKWMEKWLKEAEEEEVTVIPVGHHNLLNESVLYTEDCTLKNSRAVIDLLEQYGTPVYISGHLHLQRVKKNSNSPSSGTGYGIHEIVSDALPISPCQYGVLKWDEDGSLNYHTKTVDVSARSQRQGSDDENLLEFDDYSSRFLTDVISSQLYRAVFQIPDDRKQNVADLYGKMNSAYCAGRRINRIDIKKTEEYFYFERYLGSTKWFDKLSAILRDTGNDHNALELKAGTDFPAREPEKETEPQTEPQTELQIGQE